MTNTGKGPPILGARARFWGAFSFTLLVGVACYPLSKSGVIPSFETILTDPATTAGQLYSDSAKVLDSFWTPRSPLVAWAWATAIIVVGVFTRYPWRFGSVVTLAGIAWIAVGIAMAPSHKEEYTQYFRMWREILGG